jgi:hypothetical protein
MTIATDEKLERQRAIGRAKYHRWAALRTNKRAHAQGAIYDPHTLANLVDKGWIKRNKDEHYTTLRAKSARPLAS